MAGISLSARELATLGSAGDTAKTIKTLFDDFADKINDIDAKVSALALSTTSFHPDYSAAQVATVEAEAYAGTTDSDTIFDLATALKSAYGTHIAEATTDGDDGGPIHAAADSTNTVSAAAATDLATAYTLLNEMKTDFNAHLSQAGVHANNDTTNAVATAIATTPATAAALANSLRDAFVAHLKGCDVPIFGDID